MMAVDYVRMRREKKASETEEGSQLCGIRIVGQSQRPIGECGHAVAQIGGDLAEESLVLDTGREKRKYWEEPVHRMMVNRAEEAEHWKNISRLLTGLRPLFSLLVCVL